MTNLTPKQSKLAAFALLALAIALAISAVALPLWLLNQRYDAAVEDAATRLERYSRVVGMRDGLQKKAAEVAGLEANHHFLKSASPALAAAELQEQATIILDQNGGKLNSIQILPHKDDGAYRQVSVNLQLTAPLSAIKSMLYALESVRPYLFVDNFAIRAPFNLAARNDTSTEPDLIVQFDLTGYALKGAP
jgi:general secretion pathway protein M